VTVVGAVLWSIWLGTLTALARHVAADWRKHRDDPDEREAIRLTAVVFAVGYAVVALIIWAAT
jgi:hypothetical protein